MNELVQYQAEEMFKKIRWGATHSDNIRNMLRNCEDERVARHFTELIAARIAKGCQENNLMMDGSERGACYALIDVLAYYSAQTQAMILEKLAMLDGVCGKFLSRRIEEEKKRKRIHPDVFTATKKKGWHIIYACPKYVLVQKYEMRVKIDLPQSPKEE